MSACGAAVLGWLAGRSESIHACPLGYKTVLSSVPSSALLLLASAPHTRLPFHSITDSRPSHHPPHPITQWPALGNLPMDIRERDVEDLFYKYGRIRDVDIKRPSR